MTKDNRITELGMVLPEYEGAVKNIVTNCVQLTSNDRLTIVSDRDREEIGLSIQAGAAEVCETQLLLIDHFVQRPAMSFPDSLAETIKDFKPTASIYAATGQKGELQSFRFKLMNLLTEDLGCRHGHMIGINDQIMKDGMSQDYAAISKAANTLHGVLKDAEEIKVTDEHGTDLTVSFSNSPDRKWQVDDGLIIKPKAWANLPAGEVFTCPEVANGQVVAWEAGDYFSEKYGLLRSPVILNIENSRVVGISGENTQLNRELEAYLKTQENSNRMGEFAIGCLLGLKGLIGNLLQDEKFPGVHMAFGHPYPEMTGQKSWDADTHIDFIPLDVNAWVNGQQILEKGKFTMDLT
ncbi:MAG: aminopeptidase [Microgenomates group bacterium]